MGADRIHNEVSPHSSVLRVRHGHLIIKDESFQRK
jgi:hypothetical protein